MLQRKTPAWMAQGFLFWPESGFFADSDAVSVNVKKILNKVKNMRSFCGCIFLYYFHDVVPNAVKLAIKRLARAVERTSSLILF